MITKKNIFHILIGIAFFHLTACSKSDDPEAQLLKAEGYIIGYHPCMANTTITTSLGKGKGYLIATTEPKPDTLMVYGVPLGMFDIPEEWFSHTGGYLFPVEGRQRFKIRFTYQRATEKETGIYIPCNAMYPAPNIKYLNPEYILVKAEKNQ
ncbi:MAG: hypothetical protein V4663_16700 [Bacteroidota bacterium]